MEPYRALLATSGDSHKETLKVAFRKPGYGEGYRFTGYGHGVDLHRQQREYLGSSSIKLI